MNGYLQGDIAAAQFLGCHRRTLRRWQRDPALAGREYLTPRILHGRKYYRIRSLELFMDPALNAAGPNSPTHNLPTS